MEPAELKQKRKEFLDDTWKYYAEDVSRRAIEGNKLNKCRYKTADGRRCAIGRHIIDDRYKLSFEGRGIIQITEIIPKEIMNLGVEFLAKIQLLHDSDDNWNQYGLTETGELAVDDITDSFCI